MNKNFSHDSKDGHTGANKHKGERGPSKYVLNMC